MIRWLTASGTGVLVVAVAIAFRWLGNLQRRTNDHAERIARMEGSRQSPQQPL